MGRETEDRVPGDDSSLAPSPPPKGHGVQTYRSTSSLLNSVHHCLLPVLLCCGGGMCAMMGNMSQCDGLKAPHGDVGIKCPLPTDRNDSVVVKHFMETPGTTVEEVLDCGWYLQGFSCAVSPVNATLIGIRAGCFLFSLPENTLQRNGTYSRQMVPPDPHQPFTDCYIIDPDEAKDADGLDGGLIAAVVIISILGVIVLVVTVVVCCKRRTHEHPSERTHKWELLKCFLQPHPRSVPDGEERPAER